MHPQRRSKKDHILDTALALFAVNGFHSVGVDRICAEAGVAKMTLYKHFATKDILIEAVLALRDERFLADLQASIDAADADLARVQAFFAWHEHWFRTPDFHGCLFIKATEEFADAQSPIRQMARRHKTHLRQLLAALLVPLVGERADRLARRLSILLEGLTVHANMFGPELLEDSGWPLVHAMIEADRL